MPAPLRLAFLGCGFITRVHSRNLRRLGPEIVSSYASRDRAKAEAFRRQYGGVASYGDYPPAPADPRRHAGVVALPPPLPPELTPPAPAPGRHRLVLQTPVSPLGCGH